MAEKRKRGEGSSADGGDDENVGAEDAPALAVIGAQDVAPAAAVAQDAPPGSAGTQDNLPEANGAQVDASVEADVEIAAPAVADAPILAPAAAGDQDAAEGETAVTAERRSSMTPRVTRSVAAAGSGQRRLPVTRSAAAAGTGKRSLSVMPRATRSAAAAGTGQRSLSVTPRVTRSAAAVASRRQTSSGGSAPKVAVAQPKRGAKRKGNAKSEGSSSAPEEEVAEPKRGAKKKGKAKVDGSGSAPEEVEAKPKKYAKGKGKAKVGECSGSPEVAVPQPKKVLKGKGKEKVEGSDGNQAGKTLVIEHFVKKPTTTFMREAADFKRRLKDAIPGVTVLINPIRKETGFFTIREQGGNGDTFVNLSDMDPPFDELKGVNKSAKVAEIADRLQND